MATLDYIEVPSYATRLPDTSPATATSLKPEPKIVTSFPLPGPESPTTNTTHSPSKPTFGHLPTMLLSSMLQMPSTPVANPRGAGTSLMSTRDPLSLPIMTVNFKRFTSKIGPLFWLQDRIEEIVTWKKGWKVTTVWMAAYAFLCFFPRLVLLLPHVLLIAILLATHPSRQSVGHKSTATPAPQAGEGSVDWQANLQGIQNLLGFVADIHDAFITFLPYLTHCSPYTPVLFSSALISFLILLPMIYLLPLRPTFLVIGLLPFFLTHPFTQSTLFPLLRTVVVRPFRKVIISNLNRFVDNDNLGDKQWRADVKEVELYENERWNPKSKDASAESYEGGSKINVVPSGWGKNKLKSGERKPWTRGRDGWSGISDNGIGEVSSNLIFSLEPGWSFVETEDWRPDLEATWIPTVGADDNGWVYTNDAWLDPKPWPSEEWKASGSMTRRRRWTRRIYFVGP